MQQNVERESAVPLHAERNPNNPEEAGEEGEGTSQGDNLMLRKMRMVSPFCTTPDWVKVSSLLG